MRHIIILLILLATSSCQKDIYSEISFHIPEFKDSVNVKDHILNDTLMTKGTWGIATYKDYIIVRTNIDDFMLHFFSKKNGEKIKSFGEPGRGPNQILSLGEFNINEKQGILTAPALGENKILIFHLDSVLKENENILTKLSLKDFKGNFQSAFKCKDHFLINSGKCEVFPESTRFKLFNSNGKIVDTYDNYPINSNSDSLKKSEDWQDLLITRTISPDGTKYAEATQIGGIIEIFNVGNKIVSKIIKGYYKPHYYWENNIKKFTPKTQFGFYYLNSSDQHIYALSFNGSNNKSLPTTQIQVFDWEGNPIKKFKTNYSLLNICPDEKAKKIYAIAMTPMREPILVEFDM